jgi:hypothetical protein
MSIIHSSPLFIAANTIQATSTAVERAFSQGRHLLCFTRNRLSASNIQAQLCLGSWGRCDLLLMTDLIQAVNVKKRRWSAAKLVAEDTEEE